MKNHNSIFISLGSNLGDRLNNLQKAVALIRNSGVEVEQFSSIYETPAWGFESTPFYNACARIKTTHSPSELLRLLLRIETQLGRSRETEVRYSARTIDLDLLFYGDSVFSDSALILPHPRLHLRNFVLAPLREIASDFIHPVLKKNVDNLLKETPDRSHWEKLSIDQWSPPIFRVFPFIAIEGNIGVGKTTLAQKIGTFFKADTLKEVFTNNPHLEAFYQNPQKHALAVETFFLNDRLEKGNDFWKKKRVRVVSDYTLNKSLVFAKQNLEKTDFKTYQSVFKRSILDQKQPDLLVYLHAEIPHLQTQIKKRARSFELGIKDDYLKNIEKGYQELLQSELPFPVCSLDVSRLDFERDEKAFQQILWTIYQTSFL
jgi:2-amino-4-hydroxy-6-hydroxymethyldihydropteridine diphosphokinase